ncbi:amino acid permease [Anaeromusa acidaminophila]|uniref:amino acid permease n=1 Tax=Anaeromusa acidaminophila TaxID=81464 RepID=UPI00036F8E07|nr:amino acid permease [Anaeromusa acidaminophila]
METQNEKNLRWYNLAVMAFIMVWGFGNVVNNYANQGLTVIVSWILINALYFIPYALMVGELGSTFKEGKAGVSTWMRSTTGPLLAYLAGWTYWVVHVPYLAQKPQMILVAMGWGIFQDGKFVKMFSPMVLQLMTLALFLFFLWIASRGVTSLKRIGMIAGTSMLVMSFLYILLMMAAPALRGVTSATTDLSLHTFIPNFDFTYFTTISMLVFAVGGSEKIAPYVNNTYNASKEFPRGMIILAVLVVLSALLGSLAMGMMFDSNNIPKDLKMNGQYYAFQLLGQYYGVGNLFLMLYAFAQFAGQISALVFSIDAPLKVMLAEGDSKYIPNILTKTNEHGAPINGYKLTAVLVGILIIIPALGIGNMNDLYNWLLDLNSIVMPLRYLWVFAAYIALRRLAGSFVSDYKFVKNPTLGMGIGAWCFLFTAFACIMGMFPKGVAVYTSQWYFQITLNILTPFALLALGLILPSFAKRLNK